MIQSQPHVNCSNNVSSTYGSNLYILYYMVKNIDLIDYQIDIKTSENDRKSS